MCNRAWELLKKGDLGRTEEAELLSVALAQRAHWYLVGPPLRRAIADWRVARVSVSLGYPEMAKQFAQQSLSTATDYGLPVYFIGYAHEAMARAARMVGDQVSAAEHLKAARALLDQIDDSADRDRLETDLDTVGTLGQVYQLGRSGGGVPNFSFPELEVTAEGVVGDGFNHPKVHGGPDQALCLWALEVLATLRAEGHPIGPGAAGENVTISGLDWGQILPGKTLRIGAILVEITKPVTPCAANADWFINRSIARMSHTKHPGSARMYARVLEPGTIRVGDRVKLVNGGGPSA